MKQLFVVTCVRGNVSEHMYMSEDGENFQIMAKDAMHHDWSSVSHPKRFVKGAIVALPGSGGPQGQLGEWFVAGGVYEYWTPSREIAEAVAKTARMAGAFIPSRRYDEYMPL